MDKEKKKRQMLGTLSPIAKVKVKKVLVVELCLTLWDPVTVATRLLHP